MSFKRNSLVDIADQAIKGNSDPTQSGISPPGLQQVAQTWNDVIRVIAEGGQMVLVFADGRAEEVSNMQGLVITQGTEIVWFEPPSATVTQLSFPRNISRVNIKTTGGAFIWVLTDDPEGAPASMSRLEL